MAMSPNQYKKEFLATDAAAEILSLLKQMEKNPQYSTKSSYRPGIAGDISFSEKHFTYLSTHPTVRPDLYMANLRLMTKLR